jgi:hypothetical protein
MQKLEEAKVKIVFFSTYTLPIVLSIETRTVSTNLSTWFINSNHMASHVYFGFALNNEPCHILMKYGVQLGGIGSHKV